MGGGFSKSPSGRIIMVGLDAAGKTTLMYKLQCGEVKTTIPTIGFNLESMQLDRKTELLCWDMGGRSPLRPLWRHYMEGLQCVVFVVDSNDKERMEQAADELENFIQEGAVRQTPLLVLANKSDLPFALSLDEVRSAMRLDRIQQPCSAFSISATTMKGVTEAFAWLAKTIKSGGTETRLVPTRGQNTKKAMLSTDSSGKLLDLLPDLMPQTLQKLLFS